MDVSVEEVLEWADDYDIKISKDLAQKVANVYWDINEEDIPLVVSDLSKAKFKVDFANVKEVTYDEDEFTRWIEKDDHEANYDGGYQVTMKDGTVRYFVWKYGEPIKKEMYKTTVTKVTFTSKKSNVNESVGGVAELDLLKSAVAHGDLSAYEAVDSAFKLGHGSRMPDEEEVIDIIDGLMDDEIDVDEAIDEAYERGWGAINQACTFA